MKKLQPFILALGLMASSPGYAFNPQPDPPGFGMIGVAAGQTLRLNVSNADIPNPRGYPPDPCRVELSFFDGSGNQVVPAVQRVLSAGVSTHLDFNADLSVDRGLLRKELRPSVRFLNRSGRVDDSAFPPGPCVSSIEIIDNRSGKTLVSSGPQNPGVIRGFNPQPDPPGVVGLVGVVAGQTARLNAVNVQGPGRPEFPPDPCRVRLVFFNADGNVLAQSAVVLKPGEATLLDVTVPEAPAGAAEISAPAGASQVRGVMTIESLNGRALPPGPCRLTLEVFDNATGKTAAILAP